MSPAQEKKSLLGKVYKETFGALRAQPSITLPFFIFVIIELSVLFLIFLIPRAPFVTLFGPIVRTFWGEMFLHYPANFILLAKLSSLSRMALTVFFGSLTTAAAVALFAARFHKNRTSLAHSFGLAFKKYISLFIIVLLITGIFYVLMKFTGILLAKFFMAGHRKLLFMGPQLWMGPILICITFIQGVLVQGLFTFAIPALVIGEKKLFRAIFHSFKLFFKYFMLTIILVSLPMLVYVPFVVLNYNSALLMDAFFPEIILLLLICGALVSSLVVDLLITTSTAALYMIHKEK